MAIKDAKAKFVDIDTVADVGVEEYVDNRLVTPGSLTTAFRIFALNCKLAIKLKFAHLS